MHQHKHTAATAAQRALALLIASLNFAASTTAANTLEFTYGGFVNGGFGSIGSFDPQYDALLFKDRITLSLYFENDLSYE